MPPYRYQRGFAGAHGVPNDDHGAADLVERLEGRADPLLEARTGIVVGEGWRYSIVTRTA